MIGYPIALGNIFWLTSLNYFAENLQFLRGVSTHRNCRALILLLLTSLITSSILSAREK